MILADYSDAQLRAVHELLKYRSENQMEFFKPYEWQKSFYYTVASQRLLMAANRVGKTRSAAYEVACHLTGIYPDDWEGKKFTHPIDAWALGVSGEQIRDVLQNELFGELKDKVFTGTGMVPKKFIGDYIRAVGTPRLAKEVKVQHVTGGWSNLGFRSYTQGQHVLMGTAKDLIWIDEEPEDDEIYPQCLVRTATGDKGNGGIIIMTFTPENGMTPIVTQFMEDLKRGQHLENVTWDDAPHLTVEVKEQLLDSIPEYQRDMRTKGIPVLGEGLVYTTAEERIKCDPFEIPRHYFRVSAIDFGIDHPTSGVWVAYDADADVVYVYAEYKQAGELPPIHAQVFNAKGNYIPVIYPHDGDNTEKGSGDTLAEIYQGLGVNMFIKFTNDDGTNYVEPGILEISERLKTGRLKIFSNCAGIFKEYRKYHRKNGKIHKIDDDLMDALRYAVLSVIRFGAQDTETHTSQNLYPNYL